MKYQITTATLLVGAITMGVLLSSAPASMSGESLEERGGTCFGSTSWTRVNCPPTCNGGATRINRTGVGGVVSQGVMPAKLQASNPCGTNPTACPPDEVEAPCTKTVDD